MYYTRAHFQVMRVHNEKCRIVGMMGKDPYGVATISRLLKITGLFCRLSSLLQGSFAKETCNFKDGQCRKVHIMCRIVRIIEKEKEKRALSTHRGNQT